MSAQPNMTEQNLPNGLPPQFGKPNIIPSPVPFNGVDSSHSSRTSSPANRLQQIPASQLPPSRSAIPSSQLPPGANINQLTQNYAHLSVSHVTPISSPKIQNFGTSTPLLNPTKSDPHLRQNVPENERLMQNFNQNRDFSPITNAANNQGMFTHSANSRFANIPLNSNLQIKPDGNQYENVPLATEIKHSNIGSQGESNNLTPSKPAGSLNVSNNQTNMLSNNQINSQLSSQIDKTNNVSQDRVRIAPQGQIDTQKPQVGGVFQQNTQLSSTQPKMQQSLSQPMLDTHFKDVPLSSAPGSVPPTAQSRQQAAHPPRQTLPSFGSTPNLYQNQLSLVNQNTAAGKQNFSQTSANAPHSQGSIPSSTQQGLFTFNSYQNFATGLPNVQNVPQPKKEDAVLQQPPKPNLKVAQQNMSYPALSPQKIPQFAQLNMPNKSMPAAGPQQSVPYLSQQRLPQQNQSQTGVGLNQNMGFQQSFAGPVPQQNVSSQRVPPVSMGNVPQPAATVPLQQNVPSQRVPPVSIGTQPNVPQSMAPNAPPQATNTTQSLKANLHANRYPTAQHYPNSPQNMGAPSQLQQQNSYQSQSQYEYQNQRPNLQQQQQRQPTNNYNQNDHAGYQQQNYNQMNVVQGGFNKMWGQENYDLLQCPNILPPTRMEPPKISLGQDYLDAANCSPDIFRCTMTKIPETNTLLQKARLPLGILIHPFKDLDHLPVIQCSTIVRCRACRTYINPFVFFVDMKRWKCNLCYRVNELPEEFQFDPVSKTYGDPSRRPEIKSSTIEYIAPSEYMLRPPQPAVYVFLLDVSHAAIESGYLHTFCNVLTSNLSNLPGDARTQIGFIAYNSALHFYSFAEGLSQPHEMTVLDIDDVFLPCPDNLIVNLQERKELISDLLAQLPTRFNNSFDTGSALGAALQAAHKMIASTGGRITVFQATLPTIGPGALTVREDPSQRAGAEVHHLNPANDFYKRLALECSGQQIAVDLFILNSQYVDLATISGISRFSGGCIHHFPLFKGSRTLQAENLERTLKRYLTRKIGFEAVMRIRCTRGLSIHTFHGNFFVRSTDLLSLPNVNPEAGFGMQVSIEESLSDLHTVCFQAALLYTSSKGERRIRVHTLCVPIANTLPDVLAAADQQCIVGLLSKMAVDRSMQSSLADAREAFINVAIDILSSYKLSLNLGNGQSGLLAPNGMKLLPLYISALLKHLAFRTGTSTRLDDRVKAMCDMKSLPLYLLIQKIYPDLYPVHNLEDQNTTLNVDGEAIPQPPHLQLSARNLDSKGAFLMDMGEHMVLLVGPAVSQTFLNEALGVPDYNSISDQMYDLPNLDTPHNQRLNNFINYLNDEKPFVATLQIIRENSPNRNVFVEHLIEDRIETALSYHEFLQHLKTQVK